MKDKEIWKTLKLEPTKNEDDIVNAYRSLVVTVHPEEDPEGCSGEDLQWFRGYHQGFTADR